MYGLNGAPAIWQRYVDGLFQASDASPVGIGCVLSHVYPDGSERPIAFASRTLSGSEKKYSQIDKEALSIVWAMPQIEALPVTSKELRQETSKDIELGPLFKSLREGKDLQGREAQYTIEDGCIMYGQKGLYSKEISEGRSEELHAGHLE
ncbi:uncharacterized protein K02A2.6 [Trichonephila clavipes]|nr:uncharacterized protein K02A2.6 [Trichonephila clavipes]